MSMIEVVYWSLWGFVFCLTLVMYLRVDWHDWGAVGMTAVLFGELVLLSSIIWRYYGGREFLGEASALWKVLVLVGAPLAIAGYVTGMIRDPVPRGQLIRRIVALILALAVAYVVLDTFVIRG